LWRNFGENLGEKPPETPPGFYRIAFLAALANSQTIPFLDLTLVSPMKLTRSLLCLSVLAALSFTSCTNSEGGTTTNL
jgi:hypothetical protein